MDQKQATPFVSILRRPDGLFAYLVARREPFEIPDAKASEADLQALDPYLERIIPLRDLPQGTTGRLGSSLRSWEALKSVQRLDGTVLAHLVNVLLHSLPEDAAAKTPSPLVFPPEPPVFRPTAANPRAYRGTKDRPPKARQLPRMDLRPHLASPRDVQELILRLAPFASEAEGLLKKEGTFAGSLPSLRDAKGRVQDLYVSCLHPGSKESSMSLPPLFRRGFLFWRRGDPWRHVRRLLGLYWGLDLDNKAPLRKCLERLFTAAPFSETMAWCDLILELPEGRRSAFAELLVESNVGWKPCPAGLSGILRKANDLLPDLHYRHGIFALLDCLRTGGDPRFLLSGMELALSYENTPPFEVISGIGPAPVETIQALVDHTSDQYLVRALWQACGTLDGFSRVLLELPWLKLKPASAKELLYLFVNIRYEDHLEPDLQSAKWAVLRQKAPDLVDLLRSLPDRYQDKAIRHLKRITWFWDNPECLALVVDEYLKLLPRICRSPFQERGFDEMLLAVLTNLPKANWDRIREAPASLFRALEKASRRDNEATLVASGLRYLVLEQPDLVTDAILNEPAAVLKSAERLGGLGRSLRREVLHQWRSHPLMHDGLVALPTEKLVDLVLNHTPAELSSGIPRKLKPQKEGRAELTRNQVERGRTVVLKALEGLRWRLLGHLCVAQVAESLRPREGGDKVVHAVRFYGQIDENRRALRKFLQASFQGDADYRRRHPRNQEWLRRQKRLNLEVWLGGMEKMSSLRDGTSLRLHIELDPLEALRLGTYVGSCTGLGGSFAYSAAAVVLDLNKHVVYARNDHGAVVGRQIIAVSSKERLVVFDVYPRSVSSELKRLFRDYDLELAGRLGVDLYKPGKEDDTEAVELLLSKRWWDDSAWDLTGTDEPAADPVDAP